MQHQKIAATAQVRCDRLSDLHSPACPTLFITSNPSRLMAPRLRAVSGGRKRSAPGALRTPSGTWKARRGGRWCVRVCVVVVVE